MTFLVVTSRYQSLGLRDSDTLSGMSELKLWKWYKGFKRKTFLKEIFEKET